jgi:putative CocE/NonD family hydrolase
MRYRDSDEKPDLINPDQVYKVTVDLWATANTFQKGHVIRLQVSSSNFPRFDRNHNTGADQATSTNLVTATNTILHDADHPSALILPVIPTSTK